jgi:Mid2 like cell wall stress sensor
MSSTTLVPTTFIPGLQNEFTSTGLSNNSKKVVIGVVVGIGGAAVIALIAVIVWRHMKRENEAKQNAANLSYFSDDAHEGYAQSPADSGLANKEGEFRSPTLNAASNF